MILYKIVYATKFRELAYKSLFELLELIERGLKEIILLYIIPREEVVYVLFGGFLKKP